MAENKILQRSEVEERYTWNLADIFPAEECFFEALKEAGSLAEKILRYEGRLGESAKTLLGFFRLSDEADVTLGKIYGYASQKADEDTANAKAIDMRGKAHTLSISIAGALSFRDPELMAIPEDTLAKFYKEEPELSTYRRVIEKVRKMNGHILSPKEEALLAGAAELAGAPASINSMLQNADLKWPAVKDGNGVEHPLSNGSFVPLLESPDQAFRKKVFETYYEKIDGVKNTVAEALNSQFKQLRFYAGARNFPSTLEAALCETEVPVRVYDNLIEAVHENLKPMYRYVALRKKRLGVGELHMYDVYTPIVGGVSRKITFEEAKETVLDALKVLGDDYTALLKEGFENRWIDVYENVGKRSGAYSSGNSRPHPYVLLNHKDNLDSMFTLAHEMGHALHSYHSTKYQPVATSDYVIFVAEVASTCNEVLLMKHLLSRTSDREERAYLINHFLDSFKGTIYRQTMFAEFERIMGKMCEQGEALTAEVLTEKYLELNRLYFGPDMISDPYIGLEWARIPHFFYNYYVFQYATGYSAAVAIANRILSEGESAVRDYKKFLSGGSSLDPISLLKLAGVDMSSPEPVRSVLTLFNDLVTEMESL